jgi:Rrf2 family protein
MKLSRTVEYAIQAMVQLAGYSQVAPVPCSRLAADGQMPERFLLQILRTLVTHGMLNSTRGVDGGYSLARPADQISLLEVIEAMDGPLGGLKSPDDTPAGTNQRLVQVLNDVTELTRHALQQIKLSSLIVPAKHSETPSV